MLDGGMSGAVAVTAGNTMVLSPGGMLRLTDLDNLRVLATKKGLILQAGSNGRRSLKLLWKAGAGAPGKGAAAVAKSAQAKALAASAKSVAISADTLAKTAKSLAAPAKSLATGAGAAKVAAGTIWTGTGASLGLGLGLGALGPVLLLSGMAVAVGGALFYLQGQRRPEPPPEY